MQNKNKSFRFFTTFILSSLASVTTAVLLESDQLPPLLSPIEVINKTEKKAQKKLEQDILSEKEYKIALKEYKDAFDMRIKNDLLEGKRIFYTKKFDRLGKCFLELQAYESAIEAFKWCKRAQEEVLNINNDPNNILAYKLNLANIGSIYKALEDWNSAFLYYKNAYTFFKKLLDSLSNALNDIDDSKYTEFNIKIENSYKKNYNETQKYYQKIKKNYEEILNQCEITYIANNNKFQNQMNSLDLELCREWLHFNYPDSKKLFDQAIKNPIEENYKEVSRAYENILKKGNLLLIRLRIDLRIRFTKAAAQKNFWIPASKCKKRGCQLNNEAFKISKNNKLSLREVIQKSKKAIKNFESAIKQYEDYHKAYKRLGNGQSNENVEQALTQVACKEASKEVYTLTSRQIKECKINMATSYCYIASTLAVQGKLQQAIKGYEKAIQEFEKAIELHRELNNIDLIDTNNLLIKSIKERIKFCEKIIEKCKETIKKGDKKIKENLDFQKGLLFFNKGYEKKIKESNDEGATENYNKAITIFDQFINDNPKSDSELHRYLINEANKHKAMIYFNQGVIFEDDKKLDSAIFSYKQALCLYQEAGAEETYLEETERAINECILTKNDKLIEQAGNLFKAAVKKESDFSIMIEKFEKAADAYRNAIDWYKKNEVLIISSIAEKDWHKTIKACRVNEAIMLGQMYRYRATYKANKKDENITEDSTFVGTNYVMAYMQYSKVKMLDPTNRKNCKAAGDFMAKCAEAIGLPEQNFNFDINSSFGV